MFFHFQQPHNFKGYLGTVGSARRRALKVHFSGKSWSDKTGCVSDNAQILFLIVATGINPLSLRTLYGHFPVAPSVALRLQRCRELEPGDGCTDYCTYCLRAFRLRCLHWRMETIIRRSIVYLFQAISAARHNEIGKQRDDQCTCVQVVFGEGTRHANRC